MKERAGLKAQAHQLQMRLEEEQGRRAQLKESAQRKLAAAEQEVGCGWLAGWLVLRPERLQRCWSCCWLPRLQLQEWWAYRSEQQQRAAAQPRPLHSFGIPHALHRWPRPRR